MNTENAQPETLHYRYLNNSSETLLKQTKKDLVAVMAKIAKKSFKTTVKW